LQAQQFAPLWVRGNILVRFAFLLIVLLAVMGTSRAAEWGTLIKSPELLVSMDLVGVRATANRVEAWFLWEYRKPRVLHLTTEYLSLLEEPLLPELPRQNNCSRPSDIL
jgi:hypothetical protein